MARYPCRSRVAAAAAVAAALLGVLPAHATAAVTFIGSDRQMGAGASATVTRGEDELRQDVDSTTGLVFHADVSAEFSGQASARTTHDSVLFASAGGASFDIDATLSAITQPGAGAGAHSGTGVGRAFRLTEPLPYRLTMSTSGGGVQEHTVIVRNTGTDTDAINEGQSANKEGTLPAGDWFLTWNASCGLTSNCTGSASMLLTIGDPGDPIGVEITSAPPASTDERTAQFAFRTTDSNPPAGGFECSVDDSEFTPCTSPRMLNDLSPGEHVFRVRYKPSGGEAGPAEEARWTVVEACTAAAAASSAESNPFAIEAAALGVRPDPGLLTMSSAAMPDRRALPVSAGPMPDRGARAALAGASLESAAAKPRIARVEPTAAVPGAAIAIKGSGLAGKGTRVTVGGRTAKILRARARELSVVVPKARIGTQRVVVKRGRAAATSRLKVLRPFRGTISTTPDRRRAKSATLGPAGGVVSATGADGTIYDLSVPPGALAKDEQIGVAPITRFSGLPFSGQALGAELTPDGLTFATPATLRITRKSVFPRGLVGFAYSNSSRVLEVEKPTGAGRVRELKIEHFSTAAVAGGSPGDFANTVAPLLVEQPMQDNKIQATLDLIAAYEDAFPPAFCETQPACGDARTKMLSSLATRIQARCANPALLPTLSAIRDLARMEATRQELGAVDDLSAECRGTIMSLIFEPVRNAVCGTNPNPLGAHSTIVNPALDEGASSDLDSDGELTHLEFLHFITLQAAQAAVTDVQADGSACFDDALLGLPARGTELCRENRLAGEAMLSRAFLYARAIANPGIALQPFVDALDACRVEVAVIPAEKTLAPGRQHSFDAQVTGVQLVEANSGVTWSTTGGTVSDDGDYTAPDAPGTYLVRATSKINTNRSASATVTVAESCPAG